MKTNVHEVDLKDYAQYTIEEIEKMSTDKNKEHAELLRKRGNARTEEERELHGDKAHAVDIEIMILNLVIEARYNSPNFY